MNIDLALWLAGVNGPVAPVMLRGIKPRTARPRRSRNALGAGAVGCQNATRIHTARVAVVATRRAASRRWRISRHDGNVRARYYCAGRF
jgi:hypothetical protein